LLNGGRKKWAEEKRELTTAPAKVTPASYKVAGTDESIRAKRDTVFAVVDKKSKGQLVDVRSVDEFTGKILAPPGLSETAQRAGHIPGAANIPWSQAAREDGTFKSYDELKQLYGGKGIDGRDEVIAYCRIGERSSHTWFVLKYLLGFENVRNYDGSWTEWGNLIGAPIANPTVETASAAGAQEKESRRFRNFCDFVLFCKTTARSPSGKAKVCKTCVKQRLHMGSIVYEDLNRRT